jgi:hypothetical protein
MPEDREWRQSLIIILFYDMVLPLQGAIVTNPSEVKMTVSLCLIPFVAMSSVILNARSVRRNR